MENVEIQHYIGPIINNAVNSGVEYVKNNNIKSFVLGVSGGVDSALAAALGRMICDKTNIKLIGVFLGISGSTPDERSRAAYVGDEYCDSFNTIYLGNAFSNVIQELDYDLFRMVAHANTTIEEKIRAGNIKARLRMMYLYNLASKNNGLVLSTDNLTEYFLGFWTLHGDVGDLGLFQNLWKSEVYMMAASIGGACTACVDAIPTDGLGITNSDFDQLLPEWTPEMGDHIDAYRFIDETLINLVKGADAENEVTKRCRATLYKRLNPTNIHREDLLRKEEKE